MLITNPITTKDLIPTQFGLRNFDALERMIDFVHSGGIYNKESLEVFHKSKGIEKEPKLIQLIKFPNGKIYIHDGHHRIVSIFLCCRELKEEEYTIEDRDLDYYMELDQTSIESGWITPFDPETEVRVPNLDEYRENFKRNACNPIHFVRDSWEQGLYCKKRSNTGCFSIEDLATEPFLKSLKSC